MGLLYFTLRKMRSSGATPGEEGLLYLRRPAAPWHIPPREYFVD